MHVVHEGCLLVLYGVGSICVHQHGVPKSYVSGAGEIQITGAKHNTAQPDHQKYRSYKLKHSAIPLITRIGVGLNLFKFTNRHLGIVSTIADTPHLVTSMTIPALLALYQL